MFLIFTHRFKVDMQEYNIIVAVTAAAAAW